MRILAPLRHILGRLTAFGAVLLPAMLSAQTILIDDFSTRLSATNGVVSGRIGYSAYLPYLNPPQPPLPLSSFEPWPLGAIGDRSTAVIPGTGASGTTVVVAPSRNAISFSNDADQVVNAFSVSYGNFGSIVSSPAGSFTFEVSSSDLDNRQPAVFLPVTVSLNGIAQTVMVSGEGQYSLSLGSFPTLNYKEISSISFAFGTGGHFGVDISFKNPTISGTLTTSQPVSPLNLTSECSYATGERRWRVTNPNAFPVEISWVVYGTSQQGAFRALPGQSFFYTQTVFLQAGTPTPNTTIISWLDQNGKKISKTKASNNQICDICAKTGVSVDDRYQLLDADRFSFEVQDAFCTGENAFFTFDQVNRGYIYVIDNPAHASNGSMHIIGTAQLKGGGDCGSTRYNGTFWDTDIWLRPATAADGIAPKFELAGQDDADWRYWVLTEGKLTNKANPDEYLLMDLMDSPFAFQLGTGASGKKLDDGASMSFNYQIQLAGFSLRNGFDAGMYGNLNVSLHRLCVPPLPPVSTLNLTSECSYNPQERRWRVTNPNPFPVAVTWKVAGTTQQDSFLAIPGQSFFFTQTVTNAAGTPTPNTTLLSWKDEKGVTNVKTKASNNQICDICAKTGVAEMDRYQLFNAANHSFWIQDAFCTGQNAIFSFDQTHPGYIYVIDNQASSRHGWIHMIGTLNLVSGGNCGSMAYNGTQWDADLWFRPATLADGIIPKFELAGQSAADWRYWVISPGEAKLTHKADPDEYFLLDSMANDYGLQVGTGANGKNLAYGASTWFNYRAQLNGFPLRSSLTTGKHGDININLDALCLPPTICLDEFDVPFSSVAVFPSGATWPGIIGVFPVGSVPTTTTEVLPGGLTRTTTYIHLGTGDNSYVENDSGYSKVIFNNGSFNQGAFSIAYTGLQNLENQAAFTFEIPSSDLDNRIPAAVLPVTLTINGVSAQVPVSAEGSYSIPFSAFAGVDFEQVTSVVFAFSTDTIDAVDISFDQFCYPPCSTQTAFYLDQDGDRFGTGAAVFACNPPPGWVPNPGDCDDANASVYPGATELCNGIDDNCNGQIDEGCPFQLCIDTFEDPLPSEAFCNSSNYIITSVYVIEGLEVGNILLALPPNNDEPGEPSVYTQRTQDSLLQTGLPHVAGGRRYTFIRATGNVQRRSELYIGDGYFSNSNGSQAISRLKSVYGGLAPAEQMNLDLSLADEFVLKAFYYDQPTNNSVTLRVVVTSGAGTPQQATDSITMTMQPLGDYVIPFAPGFANINFADIDQVKLEFINVGGANDWVLEGFCARETVTGSFAGGANTYLGNKTTLDEGAVEGGLHIFPVPAAEQVSVLIPTEVGGVFYGEVYDPAGKRVLSTQWQVTPGDPTVVFPLNTLSEGVYRIRVLGENANYSGIIVVRK